jgi:hypothetical protein
MPRAGAGSASGQPVRSSRYGSGCPMAAAVGRSSTDDHNVRSQFRGSASYERRHRRIGCFP